MASRKEEKERRRQERLAQEQVLREQERRRRRYAIVAGSVLVVAAAVAVGVVIAAGGGGNGSSSGGAYSTTAKNTLPPPPRKVSDLFQAAKAANCTLKNPPVEGRLHLLPTQSTPKYSTDPPTSGNHDPVPSPDGVYTKEPKPRNFLHTLEHGRVEIQYSPSIGPRRIRQLGGLFNEDPHDLLLFPNTTMPFEVAASAWGHLAGCKRITDASFDVIRDFRDRYLDKGPEPPTTQPSNF